MAEHVIITCIVPRQPNEDSLCTAEGYTSQVRSFESLLAQAFGGYTVTEGFGAWAEDGTNVVSEKVYIYRIDVSLDNVYETASIVSGLRYQICTRFDQKAAYVAVTKARYGSSIGVGNSEGSGAVYKLAEKRVKDNAV